jgi:hypothetical protein
MERKYWVHANICLGSTEIQCPCTVLIGIFQIFSRETDANHMAVNITSPNMEKKPGLFSVTLILNC